MRFTSSRGSRGHPPTWSVGVHDFRGPYRPTRAVHRPGRWVSTTSGVLVERATGGSIPASGSTTPSAVSAHRRIAEASRGRMVVGDPPSLPRSPLRTVAWDAARPRAFEGDGLKRWSLEALGSEALGPGRPGGVSSSGVGSSESESCRHDLPGVLVMPTSGAIRRAAEFVTAAVVEFVGGGGSSAAAGSSVPGAAVPHPAAGVVGRIGASPAFRRCPGCRGSSAEGRRRAANTHLVSVRARLEHRVEKDWQKGAF